MLIRWGRFLQITAIVKILSTFWSTGAKLVSNRIIYSLSPSDSFENLGDSSEILGGSLKAENENLNLSFVIYT